MANRNIYLFPDYVKQILNGSARGKMNAIANLESDLSQLQKTISQLKQVELVVVEEIDRRNARRKEIHTMLGEYLTSGKNRISWTTFGECDYVSAALDILLPEDSDRRLFSKTGRKKPEIIFETTETDQLEPETTECEVGGSCKPCVGLELCKKHCPHCEPDFVFHDETSDTNLYQDALQEVEPSYEGLESISCLQSSENRFSCQTG